MSALRRLLIISVTEGRIAALRHAEPRRRVFDNDNPAHLSSTRGGDGCSPSVSPNFFNDTGRDDTNRLASPASVSCSFHAGDNAHD